MLVKSTPLVHLFPRSFYLRSEELAYVRRFSERQRAGARPMHVSVNLSEFTCLGRLQHRKPAAASYQCVHTRARACASAGVWS